MKYTAFEQAAVEASTGVKEIDAEIERLKTKRELLQTLVHQLLTVLPYGSDANSSETPARLSNNSPAPAADLSSFSSDLAETKSYSLPKEEWPAASPVATAEAEDAGQPSFADLLSQSKSFSLRNEGWPASSSESRGFRERLDRASIECA